jgi:Reverse transcriptase (RNA-dependent DNA polymerase)
VSEHVTASPIHFPIKIGLHQGSTLSPYIFTLVMDEITNDIQEDILWCILFADDVKLIDDSIIGVNQKLKLWRNFKIERF